VTHFHRIGEPNCGEECYTGEFGSVFCHREPGHDGQHEGMMSVFWDQEDADDAEEG
jgi:hypothetical protein